MSWIQVDLNELNQVTENYGKGGGLPEPGVYVGTLSECYLDKTSGGTVFANFVITTEDGNEIMIQGWDVSRMVKNKEGSVKNKNGGYFTGVILLNKLAKCNGKDIASIIPTKKFVKVFGQDKEVYSFNDLLNKKYAFGIRHKKYEKQDGSEGIKLDLVDICCDNDGECQNKLKARIEKRPVIEDKGSKQQSTNTQTNTSEIPDI